MALSSNHLAAYADVEDPAGEAESVVAVAAVGGVVLGRVERVSSGHKPECTLYIDIHSIPNRSLLQRL